MANINPPSGAETLRLVTDHGGEVGCLRGLILGSA